MNKSSCFREGIKGRHSKVTFRPLMPPIFFFNFKFVDFFLNCECVTWKKTEIRITWDIKTRTRALYFFSLKCRLHFRTGSFSGGVFFSLQIKTRNNLSTAVALFEELHSGLHDKDHIFFRLRNQRLKAGLLTGWLIWPHNGISNLSLSSKIFGHWHLVPNFPPVQEMLSKIHSDPSPLGYIVLSNGLGKYADVQVRNLSWCRKIVEHFAMWFRISPRFENSIWFEHCHLVQNFPLFPEMILKIQYYPGLLEFFAIRFRNSPWFQWCHWKFNPTR